MSKDVEMLVDSGREPGKNRPKQGRQTANAMKSSGAQKHLEEDLLKNAETVQSTTQALIDEGFLPSRRLLDDGFLPDDLYDCLTRMDKKDSATKMKALNDFLLIIATQEARDVVNARTFWARFFVSFMEDEDPRVRELAAKCQQEYFSVLKKDIFPILSGIIGSWWLAQFQMNFAAAFAAKNSFFSAFSEKKREEVLRRFSMEIVGFLLRRIFLTQTKNSLQEKMKKNEKKNEEKNEKNFEKKNEEKNKKNVEKNEENEEKNEENKKKKSEKNEENLKELTDDQQLRTAEALDALAGFVSASGLIGLDEKNVVFLELLEKGEFWKLGRLSNPKLRQNFFKLLAALWEKKAEWMLPFTKDAFKVIIANFHERDVRTASAVWEVLLLILSKCPTWHTTVDYKKLFLPKLFSLLKNGGFGTAVAVFPSLIVLVDKFPEKNFEFFDEIFSSFLEGISSNNLRTTDGHALCHAFCDCLKYVVKKTEKETFELLIQKYFVPLMLSSLLEMGGVLKVKGVDSLLKLLLVWQSKTGEAEADLAAIVFTSLAEKVTYAAPDAVGSPKVQLWIGSLVEAGRRVLSLPSGETDVRTVLETTIKANKPFQDLLYHLLRLSFLLYKNSGDPELSKTFLTFLRLIQSDTLYLRLKDFILDQPDHALSPQLVIFRQLPNEPGERSVEQLELFCILLCDCRSDTDAQTMFTTAWNGSVSHVGLLQGLETYRGFKTVEKFFTISHTEDLVGYSENLVLKRDFSNLSHALKLLARVGGDMEVVGKRLFAKITSRDALSQLRFLKIFFTSIGSPDMSVSESVSESVSGSVSDLSESVPESVSELVYQSISTAVGLAGQLDGLSDSVEKEAIDILSALRQYVSRPSVDWTHPLVLSAVQTALQTAPLSGGPTVIEDLKRILIVLLGNSVSDSVRHSVSDSVRHSVSDSVRHSVSDSVRHSDNDAVRHLVKLSARLADFRQMSEMVLGRKDIFLLRLSRTEKGEELKLTNSFWDGEIEQTVLTCCLVLELVPTDRLLAQPELFTEFFRCVLAVTSYVQLNFRTGAPAVFLHDLYQNLKSYQSKLLLFFKQTNVIHFYSSFLQKEFFLKKENVFLQDFLFFANPEGVFEVESFITSKTVEEMSELELSVSYSCLRKCLKGLSEDALQYKDSLRDRMETLYAFAQFPRTCKDIQSTPWEKVEGLRLIPVLLSERCLETDYSSAVLDVLGTVVIDWIACLQQTDILKNEAKVFVLVQAAVEGVLNIVQSADKLKNSGMLWVELTEFSFPRILASLLDGMFRFAEEGDEYLSERHPLIARLIATICALVQQFAALAQGSLRPVWDTMFNLEFGLPERLSVLHTTPTEMIPALNKLFAPLLLHKIVHFQIISSDILVKVIPFFPSAYASHEFFSENFPGGGRVLQSKENDPSVEAVQMLAPPVELLSVLEEAGEIVETMLQEVSLGASFGGVVPQTDSYTYLMGYLMVWRCIFAWIKNETLEAKQAFAKHLEVSGSFNALLDNLVRLLPLDQTQTEPDQNRCLNPVCLSEESRCLKLSSAYLSEEGQCLHSVCLSGFVAALTDVEEWSRGVFSEGLKEMPMIGRSWFSRKQGPLVKQITAYTGKFVSPAIIAHELTSAASQARQVSFDNFKFNVRPTVAEITAEYRVEVWVAEIVVKIPKDYPLGSVQVFWGRTKGSAMDAWDPWVIRLAGYLRRQNGTILDGIIEWKKSVDKKFQGVEACAICLSIVETKTAAVPQERCKTCKNKFHTECLNRWFQQQVDPTCPLCREKFFT